MKKSKEKSCFEKLWGIRRYYLTRKETAKLLGISYRHTGRLLKGSQTITPSTCKLIDFIYDQIPD